MRARPKMLKRWDAVGFDELVGYVSDQVIENLRLILDRPAPPPGRATATHCKRGHEINAENMVLRSNGKRQCRLCLRFRMKEKYWRNPEKERLRAKVRYYGGLKNVPSDEKARRDAMRDMKRGR